MKVLVVLFVFCLTFSAYSEVVKATDSFFHIKIEARVKASPEESYAQFIRIGEWWSSDHTWFGDAKNMTLEPKAGGCFCEKSDGQEVLHMTVSGVFPNKELRMLGGLGPLQMLGLSGAMAWKFVEAEDGSTTIIHEYRVNGGGQDDLPKLAEIVDKVQTLQVSLLAKKLIM